VTDALLDSFKKLLNRRIGVLLILGFASGLPLDLTGNTLKAWFTENGIDLTTIGLLSLIKLPYVLKALWSPLLDRFVPPFLGRRRGWMLVTQIAVVVGLVAMATSAPTSSPGPLWGFAVFVAFASASQDIVLDAYRTDVLHDRERGFGAAIFVAGYRVGMLVAGGFCWVIADEVGWPAAYMTMAALMGLGVVATFIAPRPEFTVKPPQSLGRAVVDPLLEFVRRKDAIWLLLAVFLFKLGDAFAGSLFTPFLLRGLQFTATEVGVTLKTVGFAAVMGGMLVGGLMMTRLGLWRSLLVFGVLQAVSNLFFMVLAEAGHDYSLMVAGVAIENVTGGMGTAAFVAFLMALCNNRFTATQYALLSALATLGQIAIGPYTGPIVESVGWTSFFAISGLVAVPGILLVALLRRTIHGLEHDPEAPSST